MKKFNKEPALIHRIVCKCGWYNDIPSKKTDRCKKCGRLLVEKEYFKERLKRLRNIEHL